MAAGNAAPEPAAADAGRDRHFAARRLALAAVASGLVHLALFGGLSATRIGLFDGRPQDATAPRPVLKPKLAADYPLTVPRDPVAKPAHERPLDLSAPPAAAPGRPRPAPEAVVDRRPAPEQPTEPAAPKPDLSRIEPSRDVAPKETRPLDRQAAPAVDEPAATAERLPAVAAPAPAPATPKPAATLPRAAAAVAAVDAVDAVDRAAPPAESPATAAGPAGLSVPREQRIDTAPAAIDRSAPKRMPMATPGDTPGDIAVTPPAALPAIDITEPPAPLVPRPGRDPARLAARPGTPRAAIGSPAPAAARGAAEEADAAEGRDAIPGIRPLSPRSLATPERRVTGPQPTAASPGSSAGASGTASADGPAAPAPLARVAPSSSAATVPSAAVTATVPPAVTATVPPAVTATVPSAPPAAFGSSVPVAAVTDAPGWAAAKPSASPAGGMPAPAATAGSRLAARASGRGGATGPTARAGTRPGAAATGGSAGAAIAGPSAAADEEESLSVGGAGEARARVAAPRRDAGGGGPAGGAPAGATAGRGPATGSVASRPPGAAAAGGDAGATGDAPGHILARPLGRASGFALPAEGREREVAMPFARRSRAEREAARRDAASDIAVREKARAAADGMVDRGLGFLARAQRPDGRWRLEAYPGAEADAPRLVSDTAATGLAILSFLGAGHDHFGGPHRDTVRRGLEFLLSVQKRDGDLYVPADELSDSCAWLYSHGIASMALCEAVGMTGDPLVKPAAARACGFIAASQHPARGGWRYTPRSDADLSVSGWMLVALRSGRLAGVEVEPRALAGVKALLDQSAVAGDPARYLYNARNAQQRPSRLSSACMTAVGTLGRLHTGWSPDDPRVRRAADTLLALKPAYGTPAQRSRDCYLWYYASQVLVHTGGDAWADWYDALADTLEPTQERSGPAAGSWDPLGDVPDRWGAYGGRIYVTALHLLALEVPDRRLPTYGSPEDVGPPAPARGSKP